MKDNILRWVSEHPRCKRSKFVLGSGTRLLRKITSLASASVSPPHLGRPLQQGSVLCPCAVPTTLKSCSDLWPLSIVRQTQKRGMWQYCLCKQVFPHRNRGKHTRHSSSHPGVQRVQDALAFSLCQKVASRHGNTTETKCSEGLLLRQF